MKTTNVLLFLLILAVLFGQQNGVGYHVANDLFGRYQLHRHQVSLEEQNRQYRKKQARCEKASSDQTALNCQRRRQIVPDGGVKVYQSG